MNMHQDETMTEKDCYIGRAVKRNSINKCSAIDMQKYISS